jgi:hypothetical protein
VRGAKTISSGVPSTDDYHPPAGREDFFFWIDAITGTASVLLGQILHREMDPFQLAARYIQIPGLFGASGKKNSIIFPTESRDGNVAPDMRAGFKFDSFLFQLLQPAVKNALFQFEIRNSVAQQPPNPVRLFKYDDRVAGSIQLLRSRQTGGSRTDDGYAFPGPGLRRFRPDPAFTERTLDDRILDLFDGDGRFVDTQYARGFAWSRANQAGEFRKVVGGMECANRIPPAIAINQIIPVRDQVVQRTTRVTERALAASIPRNL